MRPTRSSTNDWSRRGKKMEETQHSRKMLPIPSEDQALLNCHLTESVPLMHKYTDPNKSENFESTEVELRNQLQSVRAISF